MKSLLFFFSLAAVLGAQVFEPPPQTAPATTAGAAPNGGKSALTPELANLPVFDPTKKTFTFQGQTHSMLDNNLGGQFEAYLASTEYATEESKQYRAVIDKILDLVSPTREGGAQLREAYDLLEKAAEHPGDGNISDALANSIYSALLTRRGEGTKAEAIQKLNAEQRRLAFNMDVMKDKIEFKPAASTGRNSKGGTAGASANQGSRSNSTEYFMMEKRLAEIELLKQQYEAGNILDQTQSKIQYQALMVQLFVQRRFQHVIMAARFYNLIYSDGDQKMEVKEGSEVEKFFGQGIGVNPTVAGIDAAANEAVRKATTLVDAFENNLKNGRLHAGSDRLMEAFAVGEFLPVVQTVPNEKKALVQQYIQDSNDLIEALSARDLGTAEALNDSLQEQASDYSAAKATALIAAGKRGSEGYVRSARMALLSQETEKYELAMKEAIQLWPNNPAIGDLNQALDARLANMAGDQDVAAETVKEFDSLLAAKSYRSMVEEPRKSRFVVVLGKMEDQPRLDKFNEIAESIISWGRGI